ncbi:uncharacterized protein BO66DRAFT_436528 [Aspergillus aculeatinus CBS 121060]|uniref:Uncharacterized protein n=1 Tax=Aspergillus aculeatinus CBS 121060 TaxID=1448322 RepID=A0ACD1HG32_9EURO|nr:hypothetical protein BO66DRAFT_436528 [Aspergillus aculeatinus CBS 121060]RAH72455.1 hypothetical protein BO66DRAFT_436528 [Aspergillus aculeatinus CBS 121060]
MSVFRDRAPAGATTPTVPQTMNNGDEMARTAEWLSKVPGVDRNAAWRPDYPLLRATPFDSFTTGTEDLGESDDGFDDRSEYEFEDHVPSRVPEAKPLIIFVYIPDENEEAWEQLPPGLGDQVEVEWTCTVAGFERLVWHRAYDLMDNGGDDEQAPRVPNPQLRGVVLTTLELLTEPSKILMDHINHRQETLNARWPLILAPEIHGAAHEQIVQAFLSHRWGLRWRLSGCTIGFCSFRVSLEAQALWDLEENELGNLRCNFSRGVYRLLDVERNVRFLELYPGQLMVRDVALQDIYFAVSDYHFVPEATDETFDEWCSAALDWGSHRGFVGCSTMHNTVMHTVLLMCGIQRGGLSMWRGIDSDVEEPDW